MTPFILHAGLQKTATTTIQKTLFSNHSEILYLGKYAPSSEKKGCRSKQIYHLLAPALWQLRQPFDLQACHKLLHQEVMPKLDGKKAVVASWESLAGANSLSSGSSKFNERLRRLTQIFGSCRVIICIRHPVAWFPSVYLQELRGHYVKRQRSHLGQDVYLDFDQWLDRWSGRRGNGAPAFAFGENIRTAVDLLGKENVGVFLFEELVENPAIYYTKICQFLGVDVDEGLRLTDRKALHLRISRDQLELMRETQSSLIKRCHWLFASRERRKAILEKAGAGNSPKASVELSAAAYQTLVDSSKEINRWLLTELGLPLDKYGYPL
jgi:hypothetical protein